MKEQDPGILTKTGFMVGLGETDAQISALMDDVLAVGCDILTIGQYLQPSEAHWRLARYAAPEDFARYKQLALARVSGMWLLRRWPAVPTARGRHWRTCMIYIETGSTDAYYNFGLEYYFAAEKKLPEPVLLFWRTTPTLMVGKYQNILEEINKPYADAHKIRLVRRMSGGGTIYTDLDGWQFTLYRAFRPDADRFFPVHRPRRRRGARAGRGRGLQRAQRSADRRQKVLRERAVPAARLHRPSRLPAL